MEYVYFFALAMCLIAFTHCKLDGPGENVCSISKVTTQYVEKEVKHTEWGIEVVPRNKCFCAPFFCDDMFYWKLKGFRWACVMDKLYVKYRKEWVCETREVIDYYCCEGYEAIEGECIEVVQCQKENGGCDQLCLAKSCQCYDGYDYDDLGEKCVDINECGVNNGGCYDECKNTEGSYYCECKQGFQLIDHHQCEDVDECEISNGGCQQICQNQEGGWKCDCEAGFELEENFQCDHLSLCDNSNEPFKCNDLCSNQTSNNEKCSCDIAQLDLPVKTHCRENNPCTTDNGGCSHICVYEDEEMTCECPDGFDRLDDYKCENINECDENNGGCSHACIDIIGDFECFCPSGFNLLDDDRTCNEDLGAQTRRGGEEPLSLTSIIGAVIGCILFLCIIILITFLFLKTLKRKVAADENKQKSIESGKGFNNMAYGKNMDEKTSNSPTVVYSNAESSHYDNGSKPCKDNVYSNAMDQVESKSIHSSPPTNPPPRFQRESETHSIYPSLY